MLEGGEGYFAFYYTATYGFFAFTYSSSTAQARRHTPSNPGAGTIYYCSNQHTPPLAQILA